MSASLSEEVACLLRRFLPTSGFLTGVPSSPDCSSAIAGHSQEARPRCLAILMRGMLLYRCVLTFSKMNFWIQERSPPSHSGRGSMPRILRASTQSSLRSRWLHCDTTNLRKGANTLRTRMPCSVEEGMMRDHGLQDFQSGCGSMPRISRAYTLSSLRSRWLHCNITNKWPQDLPRGICQTLTKPHERLQCSL